MMQGWAVHPLDDLLANNHPTYAPLFRRASFGKYSFKNRATFDAFADAQRALYDTFDKAGKDRQRELLIKLCDTGKYPPLAQPVTVDAELSALLTPAPKTELIGMRTYHRFGMYLVQREILDDFIQAHEYLARYDEERVRGVLAALCAGGPDGIETKLVDNQEWNTAFSAEPDYEGRHTIYWDRRMMIRDRSDTTVPAPVLLLHEEQLAVDHYNDPSGTGVLQATPSKEYGNHLVGSLIRGIERDIMLALGLAPRESHHGIVIGALTLTSTNASLAFARGNEPFQRVGEHETVGQVVKVQKNDVILRTESGELVRYDLRELSNFMSRGADRGLEGSHGSPKRAEKRFMNTLKILQDAYVNKDLITIGIRGENPPTYENTQQLVRMSKSLSQHFHLPKTQARDMGR